MGLSDFDYSKKFTKRNPYGKKLFNEQNAHVYMT